MTAKTGKPKTEKNKHDNKISKMRKHFLIYLPLTFLQFTLCSSQKSDDVTFKVRYQPSHSYNQTLTQNSHTEITYKADQDILDKLKANGIANPTIQDNQQEVTSVFKTGKQDGNNFPMKIEFIKTTSSSGRKDIPDGTKIYAHGSIDELPTIDSVSSNEMTQDYKDAIKQSIQSVFYQMNLPEKKVKIGAEFTRENPLSIPIAGVTINMTITTHYKLISVSHDKANFDISQVYTVKTDMSGKVLKASGEGKGKLIYDTRNNFYLRYQIDTNLDNEVALDKFTIEMKSSSSFIQATTITTE